MARSFAVQNKDYIMVKPELAGHDRPLQQKVSNLGLVSYWNFTSELSQPIP